MKGITLSRSRLFNVLKLMELYLHFWSIYFSFYTSLFRSVHFSHSVISDSLWPHELQHARSPCPSPTPEVYPNPCPLSRWCHLTISSSVVYVSSCLQSFPNIRVFSNELALCIWWWKYWRFSFNISPSNEHWGLISFRMDWLDLLAVQGTLPRVFSNTTVQKHQFFCACFLYSPTLTYMTTGKTISLTRWTFVDKAMPLLFNMLYSLVITFLPGHGMQKRCKGVSDF